MKKFSARVSDIKNKIASARGFMLLLDFDGTISPIVSRPENAYLPERNRRALALISRYHPIAVITGRSLSFIRKKVPIRRVLFGASHGIELDAGSGACAVFVSTAVIRKLKQIRSWLNGMLREYPRLLIEEKRFSIAFHYHLLPKAQTASFLKRVALILKPFKESRIIKIFEDKKTIEFVPKCYRTKGDVARILLGIAEKRFKKQLLPIYIGDTSSDEDAFRVLRSGITIRVGKKKGSEAQYYFTNRKEVDSFLAWLCAVCLKRQ